MMSARRLFRLAPFVLMTLALPNLAYADDAAKRQEAQIFFDRGIVERDAGHYDIALDLFQQADKTYRTEALGALYNIALCEQNLGQTLAAYIHYDEYVRDATDKDKNRERDAKRAQEKMLRTGPLIQFVGIEKLPDRTQLLIDNMSVGPVKRVDKVPAQAGAHTVVVRAPDMPERSWTVQLVPGQSATVDVAPDITLRKVGIAVTSVGAASVVAGVITGSLSWARKGHIDKNCQDEPVNCTSSHIVDYAKTGEQLADASTATFIIGGAFLAAGMTMVLWPKSKQRDTAIVPVIGPSNTGLFFQTRF